MSWLRRGRRRDQYPRGSCTRHVYDSVPWVPLGWGDAHQWAESARTSGLKVDGYPARGSIAVYPPGPIAGPLGHVVLVNDVADDGRISYYEGNPARVHAPLYRTGWEDSKVRFILPPEDTTQRLARGELHSGAGQADLIISQVVAAWDDLTSYWNLRVGVQHDILQAVNRSLGQFM